MGRGRRAFSGRRGGKLGGLVLGFAKSTKYYTVMRLEAEIVCATKNKGKVRADPVSGSKSQH